MKDIDAQKIWEAVQKVDEADYVPPQDDDALARAKQRGYDKPYDGLDDQHRQNVDQHTLLNALNSRIQQTTDYASIEDFAIKRMRELYDRYVEQGKDIEEIEKLLVANWIDGFIEDAILRAEY